MSQISYIRSALSVLLFSFLIISPLHLNAQAPWTVNAADYENNGSMDAVVILDGAEVTTGYLGAFVGNECRGVAEGYLFPPTGKTIFGLMCYSNVSSGEMLSFRYYDPGTDTEYLIQETIEFVANMTGDASDPHILHAGVNSAPVASCPAKATLDPAPGPISFNLCTIFSDPEGDALTYDATASAGATLNWINGCELEVTTAASGTTTLTLSATDGEFTTTCDYSFTVTANRTPVVDQPVGMRVLDEGFASVQIDLSTVFSDPDGDVLTYTAVPADAGIVTTSVTSATLTITEVAAGNTTVTVTASDGEFSVQDIITIVVVAVAPPPPWSVNAANFAYSGQLDAVVRVNGVEVNTGILAAFVGDECRGVVEGSYFAPNGKTIFALLVNSNTNSGDILTFRYYDPINEVVQVIDEVIAFSSNMTLGSANTPVQLNITSGNNLPQLDNPLADQTVDEHFGTLQIEAGAVFSDPDADALTYSATIDDATIATVQLDGSTLTITEAGTGTTVVELFASDGEFSTADRFVLTVNEVNDPPVVQNEIPDQLLLEGFNSKHIAISGTFLDPEADVLSYSATSNDETVVTVKIEGGDLVLTETGVGTALVSICVSDSEFEVCDQFEVVVKAPNSPPVVVCPDLDMVLVEGTGSYGPVNFCEAFIDPDDDALTYTVVSSDPAVVAVANDGCDITVTGAGVGSATVSVCASDGEYEVCCSFTVEIVAENEMTVYLDDVQFSEGDSVQYCSDAATLTLTVNSATPWTIESAGDWFTAEQVDAGFAEIVFTENTTGAERSGSIAVRDTQDHVINLVVYQSETCIPDGVPADALQGYKVYPNPVQDVVTIELPEYLGAGEMELQLYAADGRMLRSATNVDGLDRTLTFDMRPYRPGIYYLVIEETGARRVRIPLVK